MARPRGRPKVQRIREVPDNTTRETEYYLLIGTSSPERFLEVIRAHWGAEYRLHWRLDVVMNEDQQRNRSDNGPNNLAVLRHLALNVIQKETSKGSLRDNLRGPPGMTNTSKPCSRRSHYRGATALENFLHGGRRPASRTQ